MDTAKRVFQLYWVDMETGEIMDLKLTRVKFLVTLTPKSGPSGSSPMRPERWSCPCRRPVADARVGLSLVIEDLDVLE